MEMIELHRAMRCLAPERKSQRSVFAQKNLSTQDVWTEWWLGFQVFFCKCLDSQDFVRAWAVCAQLGPCLDSQGSLQDLASLSCLSSVGEILLSSMGALFLDYTPCWAEAIFQAWDLQQDQFILREIDCSSSVCENGKRYQRCSR